MLVNLRCDKFSAHINKEHTISFQEGLNVVCGDNEGSNAIGKSTFLLIIDFVFGGTSYTRLAKDIVENIGQHTFYYEFRFNGESYFYSRSTEEIQKVAVCDSRYEVINTISLNEYSKELMNRYNIHRHLLSLEDISEHYFRIYIRGNTFERIPVLSRRNESDEKAVNRLLQLMDAYQETAALKDAEEKIGLKSKKDLKKKRVSFAEEIAANEKEITSLQERLDELVAANPDEQIKLLMGIDEKERSKMLKANELLRKVSMALDKTKAQMLAISSSMDTATMEYNDEFLALKHFFPDCNLQAFYDIEHFHNRIGQMLQERIQKELKELNILVSYYEAELARAKDKLKRNNTAMRYTENILRQCIEISRQIDECRRKNDDLRSEQEKYDQKLAMEQELHELYQAQAKRMKNVAETINSAMTSANEDITDGTELPPRLTIDEDKNIFFATLNNTSEGTSFKNLVVYDLAMLRLAPLPILIHDSNILRNIDDVQFPRVLDAYMKSGKQIFVAFDRIDSAPEPTRKIIRDHQIVALADGQELFGHSWSKTKKKSIKK